MQDSRTPRLVEHFWVPNLGASCSNKLFVGTVRPSQRHINFVLGTQHGQLGGRGGGQKFKLRKFRCMFAVSYGKRQRGA